MRVEDFLNAIKEKDPPAPRDQLSDLEGELGVPLPEDYRRFLIACNGGYVGGALWFTGSTPDGASADVGVHHIGGFRKEKHFSLPWHRQVYSDRIPSDLLWIMDDPFGNAICLAFRGTQRECVYFWDHENEPDPTTWDRTSETALNVQLLARSFAEFVGGLRKAT